MSPVGSALPSGVRGWRGSEEEGAPTVFSHSLQYSFPSMRGFQVQVRFS